MRIVIAVGIALAAASAQAAVYKWTDAQGHVHYSDTPHDNAKRVHVDHDDSGLSGLSPAERAALDRINREEDAKLRARQKATEEEQRKAQEQERHKAAFKEYCYRNDQDIQEYQDKIERGGSRGDLEFWQKQLDDYKSLNREYCQ